MITFKIVLTLLRAFQALDMNVYLKSADNDHLFASSPVKVGPDGWHITRSWYISARPHNKFYINVDIETFGMYPNGEFGRIQHEYATDNIRKAIKKAYVFMQDEKEALSVK